MRSYGLLTNINIMNTFEEYINKTENQDLKNFTKYLDAHELAMLEMHFLSFAKEQLHIHSVVGRSEMCNHVFLRVERGGEFQGNQCECGEWEGLTR